jgi:tripartite-type tricarboxylate transporter receptor subunit TctC
MMGDVLGFKPTFVAYRGSAPAITDLLGGQVDLLWDQVTNAITQVQSGALHGIAVTSPQRLEQLKDVPTTAELGMPEVSYTMWHGLYVAKGTPEGNGSGALNAALRKAVSDPRHRGQAEGPRHRAVPGRRDVALRHTRACSRAICRGGKAGGKLGDQGGRRRS